MESDIACETDGSDILAAEERYCNMRNLNDIHDICIVFNSSDPDAGIAGVLNIWPRSHP